MIFLTGATGFVGSCVAMKSALGIRCAVRHNSKAVPLQADVFFIDSLSPETNWQGAFKGVEAVIHLAARAHVFNNPVDEFRQINVAATLHLARQAALNGVKRFVFVSSIGVNGSENERPFNEDDIPRPSGPYAISKFEAEKGLWEIAKETGLEVVVIRPPLVIGPNAPGNFGLLIRAVCKGIPLPLGLIHNKRSIVSLENLADFILLCAQHQKAANETFCIADDEDISTPKLLKLLAVAMGKPSRLISVSPAILKFTAAMIGKRAVFDKVCGSLRVDSSKAKRLLNWHPRLTTSAQIILIAEKLKADSIA